ncbi:hypothetical protein QD47_27015 [Paenibacillus terrae]|uniref:Uncharacterized protein n=1 Tax=Paenibacillus terrae TaxID=159743 RepID=A0A0D7WUF5_9BACL|nr:hypothetical protein QD47_27015 [Paenibacillus terrae]
MFSSALSLIVAYILNKTGLMEKMYVKFFLSLIVLGDLGWIIHLLRAKYYDQWYWQVQVSTTILAFITFTFLLFVVQKTKGNN